MDYCKCNLFSIDGWDEFSLYSMDTREAAHYRLVFALPLPLEII